MLEINFDGLIGPSHNYAGLSFGNIASATNAGAVSAPRAAALQGVAKMRRMIGLGLRQGILLPLDRPDVLWLRDLGFSGSDEDVCQAAWQQSPAWLRNALSASSMWAANAATVSPAPDTADGKCHISVANLSTMIHRSIEPAQILRQMEVAFGDPEHFRVHGPLPGQFGDEGAANFMRLCPRHGAPGVELLVYGENAGTGFPARQNRLASEAIARRHGLAPERTMLVRQSGEAIAAGAFHNDVVAVANENVLFTHQQAFDDPQAVYAFIAAQAPGTTIVEAPANRVSLDAAVRSYLFNSQLVTLPDGAMSLVVPQETRENQAVWQWLHDDVLMKGPIRRIEVVDVRESMRNGGGPACLRLRVAVSQKAFAAIDPRFLVDEAKCDLLEQVVMREWPEAIAPDDLGSADLWEQCRRARRALLRALGFVEGEI